MKKSDPIKNEHRQEFIALGDILMTCAAKFKTAQTYGDVKSALDEADDLAKKNMGPAAELINHLEDDTHSGPTDHEGEE